MIHLRKTRLAILKHYAEQGSIYYFSIDRKSDHPMNFLKRGPNLMFLSFEIFKPGSHTFDIRFIRQITLEIFMSKGVVTLLKAKNRNF